MPLSFFEKEFTFDRVCRIFFSSVLAVVILWLAWFISDALVPFLVGWILASVLMPIVRFFQFKLRFRNRLIAIFATFILLIGGLVGLFFLIGPPTMAEFRKTGDLISQYEAQAVDKLHLPEEVRNYINRFVDWQDFKTQFSSQEIIESIKNNIPRLMEFIGGALHQLFSLINIVFIFLYSFFILLYYEDMTEGFFNLIPQKWRRQTRRVLEDLSDSTSAYFRGQSIVAGLVGIGFCIGFLIIGLPLAIPLGLFIGLLNMIPYAQFIGFFPTLLLCALHSAETGIPFGRLILFSLLVFAVVQVIQDMILTPKIMGKVTGLNPAIILLCLSIGGELFGILGIIMALPLAPMMLTYYRIYILKDRSAAEQHEANQEERQKKKKKAQE